MYNKHTREKVINDTEVIEFYKWFKGRTKDIVLENPSRYNYMYTYIHSV